jgi:hypothetical protein
MQKRIAFAIIVASAVAATVVGVFTISYFNSSSKSASSNNDIDSILVSKDDKSYVVYAEEWWKRFAETPTTRNGAYDKTGENCTVNQNITNVWFLDGTDGGTAERNCTVPSGRAIFTPIMAISCSGQDFPGKTVVSYEEFKSCVDEPYKRLSKIELSVDGINIPADKLPGALHVGPFDVTFPESQAVYDAKGGTTKMMTVGTYFMFKPLSSGNHEIHFVGVLFDAKDPSFNLLIDVKYHLIVA